MKSSFSKSVGRSVARSSSDLHAAGALRLAMLAVLMISLAQVLYSGELDMPAVQRAWAQSTTAAENAQFLSAHNAERNKLGLVPLTWDTKLVAFASAYAASQDKAGAGCAGVLKHSGGPYGENLYWYWTSTRVKATPSQALADWISEKQYYNYQTNKCASGRDCGHYTQVVWARTRRVGCVARKCTSNTLATYIICNYDPPGNYVGQRPY